MPAVPRPFATTLIIATLLLSTNPALAWWWGGKDWGGPWTGAYNPWNASNNLPGPRFDSWSNPWTTGWGIPGFNGPYFSSGIYAAPYPTAYGYGPWQRGYPSYAPPPPPIAAKPVR